MVWTTKNIIKNVCFFFAYSVHYLTMPFPTDRIRQNSLNIIRNVRIQDTFGQCQKQYGIKFLALQEIISVDRKDIWNGFQFHWICWIANSLWQILQVAIESWINSNLGLLRLIVFIIIVFQNKFISRMP